MNLKQLEGKPDVRTTVVPIRKYPSIHVTCPVYVVLAPRYVLTRFSQAAEYKHHTTTRGSMAQPDVELQHTSYDAIIMSCSCSMIIQRTISRSTASWISTPYLLSDDPGRCMSVKLTFAPLNGFSFWSRVLGPPFIVTSIHILDISIVNEQHAPIHTDSLHMGYPSENGHNKVTQTTRFSKNRTPRLFVHHL